jgi:uncharacterized protein (UPF0332 family)
VSFDWRGYLTLARELAAGEPDEARARSAISRAYYAAFHVARIYQRDERHLPLMGEGRDHERVARAFADDGRADARAKQVGIALDRLIRRRRAADYDGVYRALRGDLSLSLVDAGRVIELVGALRGA